MAFFLYPESGLLSTGFVLRRYLTRHTATLVQPVRGEVDAAGLPGRVVGQILGQLQLVSDGGLAASIVVSPTHRE